MENYAEILRSRLNDPAYEYRRDSFVSFLKAPVRTYKESPTVKEYVDISDNDLEKMVYGGLGSQEIATQFSRDSAIRITNDSVDPSPELARSGIIATDMITALTQHRDLVGKYVYPNLGRDRTEYLINSAWTNGLFLYIPDGTSTSLKLEWIAGSSASFAMKSVIIAGKDSKVVITDEHFSSGEENGIQGHNIYCFVGENGNMQYNYLQDKSTSVTDLTYIREFLDRYAQFHIYHINHGGSRVQFTDESVQLGESSDFRVYGVNFSGGSQGMDIRDSSFQKGIGSSADIQVRGVVTGKSSTIHRGNVDLEEEAVKATGFYDSKILLLSQEGFANSKPGLMIKNANTRSKHGSSISDVDEEQIFYLRSRGVDEETARGMVTAGFVGSVIERAGNPEFTRKVYEYAEGLGANAFLGSD